MGRYHAWSNPGPGGRSRTKLVRAGLFLPAPVVTLQADPAGGFDSATLNYVYAPTGQPRTITAP